MNKAVVSGLLERFVYQKEGACAFIVKSQGKHSEFLRVKMFAKSDPDAYTKLKEKARVSIVGYTANYAYESAPGNTTYGTEIVVEEIDLQEAALNDNPPGKPIPPKVEPIDGAALPWQV